MAKLIVVRHHESEWNKKGLWTGSRDVHLTPYGFQKSEEMGSMIKDIPIDYAFASMQVRSIETLSCILNALELYHIPTQHSSALNERDYGDYTGKNKWEMEKLIGEEAWNKMRREWNYPVPNGETLKMVYDRVVPFYKDVILPLLRNDKNVLMVSHGNAIRALMKYVEKIPDEGVSKIEMLFGGIVIYDVDEQGCMTSKEVRKVESEVHA
jgi:2,3-bisphosphoglycerate-dependent phosphoglycerate mutase